MIAGSVAGRRAIDAGALRVFGCDPLMSSHVLADVERIADERLVVHKGCVVRAGRTDTLIGDGRTLEEALDAWGAV